MGYTTDFEGSLKFDRPLEQKHANYLRAFARSRRMKRNPEITETLHDPIRVAVGLPVGLDGGFYVGQYENDHGQVRTPDIIDYNTAPGHQEYSLNDFKSSGEENVKRIKDGKCQPGLWCQWTISDDNTKLEWDGGEKFYEYKAWLKYLIDNFIAPWGYKCSGTIKYQGEDMSDKGKIVVKDNFIK